MSARLLLSVSRFETYGSTSAVSEGKTGSVIYAASKTGKQSEKQTEERVLFGVARKGSGKQYMDSGASGPRPQAWKTEEG
jgi:hypothetical protein